MAAHPLADRARLRQLSIAFLAVALSSCGGGGGGTATPNAAPPPGAPAPAPAPGSPAPAPSPGTPAPAPSPAPPPSSTSAPTRVVTLASGLDHPWGIAFLPDGRYLVTERPGRLRIVASDGSMRSVSGLPAVEALGQGGLLDVVLDPAFASNRTIYWSYAETGPGETNGLAVARGVIDLGSASLSGVQVILRQVPKVTDTNAHYGGRMVFAPDGRLFITMGDRLITSQRGYAQDLSRSNGKVARINPDGSVPADNPFVGVSGARPEIWSYGHRNPQGVAIHPFTGQLWTAEHGPQGGDEVNVTRAGFNYGWPLISYGCEYGSPLSCTPVGGATSGAGLEQPLTYWVPLSTAPSNMMIYGGSRFTSWRGKAFVAALNGSTLWQLDIDQSAPIVCSPPEGQSPVNCRQIGLVRDLANRVRDVRQGPDGYVYLLTDEGGTADRLLRLE